MQKEDDMAEDIKTSGPLNYEQTPLRKNVEGTQLDDGTEFSLHASDLRSVNEGYARSEVDIAYADKPVQDLTEQMPAGILAIGNELRIRRSNYRKDYKLAA